MRGSGGGGFVEGGDGLMGIDDVLYSDSRLPLAKGDMLILYTDGLVERRGESLDAGLDRLARAAASGPDQPQALCEHILERVLAPEPQAHDDVTAVVVKVV